MDVEKLIGLTLKEIKQIEDEEELIFITDDNRKFRMWHIQGCCEDVYIEDICGDLDDLLNSPILGAYESSNQNEISSETWTFYHIWTAKGTVSLRWYGSSNGYYSEEVDFEEIKENEDAII